MPDFSALLEITLFALAAVGVVLGVYFLSHRLLFRRTETDTANLAGSVIFRIAALHSLILGLVFAQEQAGFNDLRTTIVREADAVADIYNDLIRYDAAATGEIRTLIVEYVKEAAGPEWRSLAESRLSARAWALWDEVYEAVLDLAPQTERQQWLHANLRHDIDTISDTRTRRELAADGQVTSLFWIAALGGLVLIAIPYFTFRPSRLHITLLTVFAVYNGLILFFIAALANPFTEPASIAPHPFERLIAVWDGG